MNEKKNWALNLTICVLFMAGLSPMAGAQVSVPNVFENGKVADADEVNENFKALADGINSLPAGAKGEQGEQGVPGTDGAKGEKGVMGTAGAQGPQGDQGDQGAQGLRGDRGASCTVTACAASATATLRCEDGTSVEVPCVKGYKTVFLSSETYKGDFGGAGGADAKCQMLADAEGLPGTYKAWIGDPQFSVDGFFPDQSFSKPSVPYKLTNGTVIASSYSALTDGGIEAPISLTEKERPSSSRVVWTNVLPNGTLNYSNPLSSCDGFRTDRGDPYSASAGFNDSTGSDWTEGPLRACAGFAHLYCFEQ